MRPGWAKSPPRSVRPRPSTLPRAITSNTSRKTRTAIAASAVPAWPVRYPRKSLPPRTSGSPRSVSPEGRGIVQPAQVLAQLPFPAGKDLVVDLEHSNPGARGGAPRLGLGKQLDHKFMRYPNVVRVSQIALEPFQLPNEFFQSVLIEEAAEQLDRVTELLYRDTQPVSLRRRQPADVSAEPPRLSSPPIEYAGRYSG